MIGEKILEIRKGKSMSLREFAELVKLSHTNISRFEKGYDSKGKVKGSIQIDDLKQICDRSGYPFRQFLEETNYIKPVILSPLQRRCARLDEAGQQLVMKYIDEVFGDAESKAISKIS